MRKDEIKVGFIYANPTGKLREVVSEKPVLAWAHQFDQDIVQYEEPCAVSQKPKSMTRVSFARWAKRLVGPSGSVRVGRNENGDAVESKPRTFSTAKMR